MVEGGGEEEDEERDAEDNTSPEMVVRLPRHLREKNDGPQDAKYECNEVGDGVHDLLEDEVARHLEFDPPTASLVVEEGVDGGKAQGVHRQVHLLDRLVLSQPLPQQPAPRRPKVVLTEVEGPVYRLE